METKHTDAAEINYRSCNLFKINNRTVCLLCMENITCDTHNSVSEDKTQMSHLQSEPHKMKVKLLFKECVSDPLIDSHNPRFANVVNCCFFDLSTCIGNKPSYLCQDEDYFVCLICSEKLCQTKSSDETFENNILFDHLRSESHMKNIKCWICWKYMFDENHNFIMIFQSIVYCSLCKNRVRSTDNTLLQTLVDHLENEHDHHPQRNTEDAKKGSYMEDCILNCTIPKFDKLSILGDCPNGDETSELDDEFSETEDYDETLEALTCLDCGDFIEVINENAEFSLQFHSQKHRDLKSINSDGNIEFNSNVDYACPICQEIIPIFNKNIEFSVSRHFEERKVDHEGLGSAKVDDKARSDLLAHAFTKLPESMHKYTSFLIMKENNIFCELCNCTLPVGNSQSDISEVLVEHISSSYHGGQIKSLSQDLAMVVVDYNKQLKCDQPQQLDLFETVVKKHHVIQKNTKFFEKRKNNYFCQICQRHICHSPNEATLALNFICHLKGQWHKKALNEMKKKTFGASTSYESEKCRTQPVRNNQEAQTKLKCKMTNVMFQVLNRSAAVSINQKYVQIKMEVRSFYCEICDEEIDFSRSGSNLIAHCMSSPHNEVLIRNASVFVSSLHISSRRKCTTAQLKNVLDTLSSCEFLKPHVQFIYADQDCRCVVCDVTIPPTKKNVQEHLFGNNHKNNTYRVITQIQSKFQRKRTQTKANNQSNQRQNVSKELAKKSNKALASLLSHSPIVHRNSKFIEVKNGYFFCNICCEQIQSNNSGKYLKAHLLTTNHKQMVKMRPNY